MLLETNIGTLADQLNVTCFSNISIISDSYLSNKFKIMSGTLFSLMDLGAVLSRYDDGTEYKGMSAFGSVDHFRRLDEDPTSPNPSSSSSLILPIQNTAPHRLCSSATPTPTPAPTRVELSSFGEAPPPPNQSPHPSPFVRNGELRRALKNRLAQFWNLVYCDLTSVEYKRRKPSALGV